MTETETEVDRYIGQQVATYRRVRGMTQKELADLVGIHRSAIAQYETGHRALDSRELLYGLAEALQVSVADLTDHQQDKINPSVIAFHAQVPRIEAALMSSGRTDDRSEPAAVDQLVMDSQRVLRVRMANDYTNLGRMLPPLITDLYRRTTMGDERDQIRAWQALTRATFATALATKGLGYTSLGWVAARAAQEAAEASGDLGGIAAAAFAQAQVLLSTPGSVHAALHHATTAADRLQGDLRTPEDLELYGMLHLQAALTSAAVGHDPATHLAEATEVVPRSGEGRAFELDFGRENVTVWRMSVANERRRGAEALAVAGEIDPEGIRTNDRRSRYFIEVGRALAAKNDYNAAMRALLRAEHASPQQVRSRTLVRELVGYMIRRARKELVAGELGKLAQRVGAVA